MTSLHQVNNIGTGVSYVTPAYKDRLMELNNQEIAYDRIIDFYILNSIKAAVVELSERDTKNTWGTAFYHQDRIILYRHSVGTFLHELAHLELHRKIGQCVPAHGLVFAKMLERLIRVWNRTEFSGGGNKCLTLS